MCIFCEHDPKIVGKYFGYHDCCVESFVEHAKQYGGGDVNHLTYHQEKFLDKTNGIAFMPCPKHAKQFNKNKIGLSDMVTNRICSSPFPDVDIDDERNRIEFKEWINKFGYVQD